jgi:hypothetical protein
VRVEDREAGGGRRGGERIEHRVELRLRRKYFCDDVDRRAERAFCECA